MERGFELELHFTAGFSRAQREAHESWLANGINFMVYDPSRPDPEQRNRVMSIGQSPLASTERVTMAKTLFRRVQLDAMAQHRVLVCDGPALLAWVGVTRERPLEDAERRSFASLVPRFAQALRLDRTLRENSRLSGGLAAALSKLDAASFLTSASGRIEFANELGRRLLDSGRAETRQQVAAAIARRGADPGAHADVSELVHQGTPQGFLVVLRRHASLAERLRLVEQTWSLTPRQLEVLGCVAAGEANKLIADKLACSERTVESHLTNLMRSSKTQSRTELVAKFLTLR